VKRDGWWVVCLLGLAILLLAGRADAVPQCSVVCHCQLSCELPCTTGGIDDINCGEYLNGMCDGNCGDAAALNLSSQAATREQRDQAFLQSLSSGAPGVPAPACSTAAAHPVAAPRVVNCSNQYCQYVQDCKICPGGLSAWTCNTATKRCTPI
jgi:hypothetical protein